MRIAQINFTRVNNALGGTEKVFFSMANAMSERGHSVGCFYFDATNGKPSFPVSDSVYIKNCYDDKLSYKTRKILSCIRACFTLNLSEKCKEKSSTRDQIVINNILKFNPDIILLYWPDKIIYKLNELGVPVVQMIHMAPSHFETDNNVLTSIEGLKRCDCIQVLVPEYVSDLYRFIKNENIVYIPNIVPQYSIQSDVRKHTIIFVGRLAEQKRPDLIVGSFALLKDKYPDWIVELWGEDNADPNVTKRLRTMIHKYDLEDRILFCGKTLDVKSKLMNASVIIMPSAHEGFCLALTEGMSMGLPAVGCRDCPSVNSLIQHGENGFLCEPTPEDIALQLSRLMDDYELRKKLGNNARKDMKQYSPDLIYDRWERLMTEVINRHNQNVNSQLL